MAGRQCDVIKKKKGTTISTSGSVAKPQTSESSTHPESDGNNKSSSEGQTQLKTESGDSKRQSQRDSNIIDRKPKEKSQQSETGSAHDATLPRTSKAAATPQEGDDIRQKAVDKIRARVDAIKTVQDIERLARIHWHEEAFQITKFVSPSRMNRNRFRIFIIEADNREDEDFFTSLSLGAHELDLFRKVRSGTAICIASKYSEMAIERNEALRRMPMFSVILGKLKSSDDLVHQAACMLEKMRGRLIESIERMDEDPSYPKKLESVAVRLPSIVDVFAGRKIVECAWRGLGVKVEFCAKPNEERGCAPRSRLCYMTIRSEADSSMAFQRIYDKLKEKVRPGAHGVEVHKVAHLANGYIRLRIKEIRAGGRETYAAEVREKLGLSSYFT